jgi:hypothetical protein
MPALKDIEDVISHYRRGFTVPVTQPLVLISQIQRSGGTLISQLLDGHSELHVHPGELHIGRPNKYEWPRLDLGLAPEQLFDALFERPVTEYVQSGYQKQSSAEALVDPHYRERVLPFIFWVRLQKQLFIDLADQRPIRCQRDALDRYVTSYFNAWLDYQGLYRPPEQVKYWAVFGARVLTRPGNFQRFTADYPDGKAIAVLRDPVSWFASARRHSGEYENPETAAGLWLESHRVIQQNEQSQPGKTLVITLEECVSNTETAMRRIARYLGIRFEHGLLTPTFNGMPIRSDSSFGAKFGLDRSAADRTAFVDGAIKDYMRTATTGLYQELTGLARAHAREYDAR